MQLQIIVDQNKWQDYWIVKIFKQTVKRVYQDYKVKWQKVEKSWSSFYKKENKHKKKEIINQCVEIRKIIGHYIKIKLSQIKHKNIIFIMIKRKELKVLVKSYHYVLFDLNQLKD
jgi:hypothetical protein